MKKAKALSSLAQLVTDAFPVVYGSVERSRRDIGVEIDGLPVGRFQIHPIGSRWTEGIDQQFRITALASEDSPLFRDPPGQPTPLVPADPARPWDSKVPLTCDETKTFEWAVDPAEYAQALQNAASMRWRQWRDDLVTATAPDLEQWVRNCELLLEHEHPWRILHKYCDAPHQGFDFPRRSGDSTFIRCPMITVFALIGFAPLLPSIYLQAIDERLSARALDVRKQLLAR